MILVPVKNLASAKQRLSPVLDAAERFALAEAMLADVLTAIAAWRARPAVAVVTSDAVAMGMASALGFEIIEEVENRSETDAIEMATHLCVARGAPETLVLPGDIPLVTSAELEQMAAAVPSQGTLFVPAADGRGTNAVWRRPAALFPLRFGNDSFLPHHAAAEASGLPVVVVKLAGIGLDVDNPSDLAALLGAQRECRTLRLLRSWRMEQRLLPARGA
ncbi:MAG TPA: 2-phospho-L-lactate guanylyltransferase [Terriglobales bacterium]|nr:2-phospho-L-lactate guanylyltransferase [Terriglobales bacterium]